MTSGCRVMVNCAGGGRWWGRGVWRQRELLFSDWRALLLGRGSRHHSRRRLGGEVGVGLPVAAGGSAGGCWQCCEPLEGGGELLCPGPGVLDVQRCAAGVEGEPCGGV